MDTRVVTVSPDASVKRAAAILAEQELTVLPVVDGDRLVGVVGESDLLRGRICRDARALMHPDWPVAACPPPPAAVGAVMTRDVLVRGQNADVAELAELMLDHGVRMIPIVRAERQLIGVVTRRALLRLIARGDAAVARDIRRHLRMCGSHRVWDVSVVDGMVTLAAEDTDEMERHVAGVVAGAIPGVVGVRVTSMTS